MNTTDGEGETSLGRTPGNDVRIFGSMNASCIQHDRDRGNDGENIRLRVLAATGLATRLASSHFDLGDG